MAPISPDNTQRFWVDYNTCGEDHSLLCRAGSTVTPSDAGGVMAMFLAAFDVQIYLLTVIGFRSAAPGTSITIPQTWPGAASYGVTAGPHYASAWYYDFVGRGATGHRARASVFGAQLIQDGNDYRITPAEQAFVTDALSALTADGDIFLDIDYEVPTWHTYANCGANAAWRNKIR